MTQKISDAQILAWLCKNLEWDGHAYWLPEICIKEQHGSEFCPEPTIKEFREVLTNRVKNEKGQE